MIEDSVLKERLMSRRSINDSGCWLWTGAKRDRRMPYGVVRFKGKKWYVHRLSAYLFLDLRLEDSKSIPLHSCDRPECFNPDHLKIGTQADNMADMIAKGRARHDNNPVGEKNGKSKLTSEQVKTIRNMSDSGIGCSVISRRIGISRGAVGDIIQGRTWGWLA